MIPEASYGILKRDYSPSPQDAAAEQVRRLGYALVESGYEADAIEALATEFESMRAKYIAAYGEQRLRNLNEFHTVRSPLTHGGETFLNLALNPNLIAVLRSLILGKFVLSQQNGVINPAREHYSQASWHRDLPYQHFVSSSPLAVNALFCIDDFTLENGATYILPASHKAEAFPSDDYVRRNALQIKAKAGQFLLLDCMMFHSGGTNQTDRPRRAVNHVYGIPHFKQHIEIPRNIPAATRALSVADKEILGFSDVVPNSVADYLDGRAKK